ncbi:MAG TPA: DoxX family protein [candidate division Zixibacteria bacterium]
MMKKLWRVVVCTRTSGRHVDAALLVFRIGLGSTMLTHGWGKLTGFGERASSFGNPIGVGPEVSMALAVFAEFFCSVALMLGLTTRLAAIPLLVTMLVAAIIVHTDDGWRRQELPTLYALCYFTLMWLGSGRYSIDRLLDSTSHANREADEMQTSIN